MKNINYFVEKCKRNLDLKSDSDMANYLGITRGSMCVIKKGGGVSQENAIKIARGAKEPLEDVWLACIAQREKNPIFKKVLENISKKAGVAASFLVVVALNSPALQRIYDGIDNFVPCILCKIREFEY